MFNYINIRIRKIPKLINRFIKDDLTFFDYLYIYIDLLFSIIIYRCGIIDYFQYNFYYKRHAERKKFMVYGKRMYIVKNYNESSYLDIFHYKDKFNKTYDLFLSRNWITTKNLNLNNFRKFFINNESIIVKPIYGSGGSGIYQLDKKEDIIEIYNKITSENLILEEIVKQHKELKKFNSSSANTLRIVTFIDPHSNRPNIMTANIRFGRKGKVADNFHHHGMTAIVDVDTGIVTTAAIDRDGNKYIYHPDSNHLIIGFSIPNWDKVIEECKNVAMVMPQVRYVGWDVLIKEDNEVSIIEGNAAADPDITQVPDQVGKWPLYKELIKKRSV